MRAETRRPGLSASTRKAPKPFSPALRQAAEDDVEIGEAGVGDPGLLAVDHPGIAVAPRRGGHRGDVRAGVGFGEREGGDGLAGGHPRQPRPALRLGAEERERAAPQALQGEGEIGDPGMAAERLADQAERADVQPLRPSRSTACRSHPPAPSRRTISRQVPSRSSILRAFQGSDLAFAPGVEIAGELPMRVLEEGPGEKGCVRHQSHQFPSKTGFSLAAKAR